MIRFVVHGNAFFSLREARKHCLENNISKDEIQIR